MEQQEQEQKHAQQYDATLKLLLRQSATVAIRELTGTSIERWLNIELPKVQNLRVDLLGESSDGNLIHIELQSENDDLMPLRMAEYCLGIYRVYRRFPRQLCVYVGNRRLRMPRQLRGADVRFRFGVVDIRRIDCRKLLSSRELSDNVIAILSRLRNHRDAVRRIIEVVSGLPEIQSQDVKRQLLVLAGLRGLEGLILEEAIHMPITADFREHKVLGPLYVKGIEEGRQQGELHLLRRQIEKRFGPLPPSLEESLAAKTVAEIEDFGLRILDAKSLDDLLK